MPESLRNGQICIVELYIFSDKSDIHMILEILDTIDHFSPVIQIRFTGLDSEFPAYDLREARIFKHKRCFIQIRKSDVLYDTVFLDVTEVRDFFEYVIFKRLIAAKYKNVRGHSHSLKFLDGMLCGLGLMLIRSVEERHQCHMYEERIVFSDFKGYLSHRLYKGLGFDITHRSAYLRNDHIGICLPADTVDEVLDLIGYMRDYLHRGSQVLAPSLAVQNVPVYSSGCQVRELVKVLIDESLVMSQVQIGLSAVIRNIDLTVLIGTHGSGINVDIGIKFLRCDLQPSRLEKSSKGCCRYSFTEAGDHSACHKYIFCHIVTL